MKQFGNRGPLTDGDGLGGGVVGGGVDDGDELGDGDVVGDADGDTDGDGLADGDGEADGLGVGVGAATNPLIVHVVIQVAGSGPGLGVVQLIPGA